MDNKKEIINGLYELKAKLSDEMFELKTRAYLLECSIDDINKKICKLEEHKFGEWVQIVNPSWIEGDDKSNLFCWQRACNVCGKKEITYNYPYTKVRSKK